MTSFLFVQSIGGANPADNIRSSIQLVGPVVHAVVPTEDIFRVSTAGGIVDLQLPNPALAVNTGRYFTVIDIIGSFELNACRLLPFGAELIMGVAGPRELRTNFGRWTFWNDGTNWWFIA